ncbi:uncharacterized protein LOC143036937 isoform X1 [Oratosquilla oratoria]|uniref:uncharacterized protein LOC143036937 isoform X1 n=1 Tax=Oratosquilla oratoria TaxID=337810 RepID=UPI003F76880E
MGSCSPTAEAMCEYSQSYLLPSETARRCSGAIVESDVGNLYCRDVLMWPVPFVSRRCKEKLGIGVRGESGMRSCLLLRRRTELVFPSLSRWCKGQLVAANDVKPPGHLFAAKTVKALCRHVQFPCCLHPPGPTRFERSIQRY